MQPIDGAIGTRATPIERRLAWMRVAIGTLFLARTTPLLHVAGASFAVDAVPLFAWPHDGWTTRLVALPASVVAVAAIARTLAALFFLVGIRAHACGLVAASLGWVGLATDTQGWANSLHLLFLTTFLLSTTRCDCALAIRPDTRALDDDPTSGLWLVRALLVSIYAWTGGAKLSRPWLAGNTLGLFIADGSLHGRLFEWLHAHDTARSAMAWSVMIFELSIGPALIWRRTRRVAIGCAFAFHAIVEVTVHPDIFGWICCVLVCAFFDDDASTRRST